MVYTVSVIEVVETEAFQRWMVARTRILAGFAGQPRRLESRRFLAARTTKTQAADIAKAIETAKQLE